MSKCTKCGIPAPELLNKQMQNGFVFDTCGWLHNEQTNEIKCPNCFEEERCKGDIYSKTGVEPKAINTIVT